MRKATLLAVAALAVLATAPASATQWGSYHWANDGTGLKLDIYHTFRNAGDWSAWYIRSPRPLHAITISTTKDPLSAVPIMIP